MHWADELYDPYSYGPYSYGPYSYGLCSYGPQVHWADEFQRWLPHLLPNDVHVIFGAADKLSFAAAPAAAQSAADDDEAAGAALPKVTITSYTMLQHLWSEMRQYDFKVVDEGLYSYGPV